MLRLRRSFEVGRHLIVSLVVTSCIFFPVHSVSATRAASIVNLLANPKTYDGERVLVIGYAREVGGFLRLYLTLEDALMWNDASSIPIKGSASDLSLINEEHCHDAYVEVIGRFGVLENLDLYGIFDVEEVTRFDLSKTPIASETCWPLGGQ